jgi:hypothetical protein
MVNVDAASALILVNASDWTALGATPEQAEMIGAEGWAVVNAPRPLLGAIAWVGPFRAGIHYAAGGAECWDGAFGWRANRAEEVRLVCNAEVEAMIQRRAPGYVDLDAGIAAGRWSWAELARQYSLPWRQED